ncbi:MAG: dithiol-disulfide isomerase [Planctomyces sp.]|nr:dithiol-disulfide isomerase [Planctomyces sp.]
MRIERLQAAWEIDVVYRHFPLHPDTPEQGLLLEELFAGRNLDLPKMQREMAGRMAAEGLEYGTRTRTCNSRLAQELGCWADRQPGGGRLHDVMFRGYFVDDINLALPDNLVRLVEEAGLDVEDARASLLERRFRDAVDADWARSSQLGITGVPTFLVAGRKAVGAQPYQVLEDLLGEAGAVQR